MARKRRDVTLINKETGEFKTFWTNVHGQHFISDGQVNGFTYTIEDGKLVKKDAGNAEFIRLKKECWIEWEDFCKEDNMYTTTEYGRWLF